MICDTIHSCNFMCAVRGICPLLSTPVPEALVCVLPWKFTVRTEIQLETSKKLCTDPLLVLDFRGMRGVVCFVLSCLCGCCDSTCLWVKSAPERHGVRLLWHMWCCRKCLRVVRQPGLMVRLCLPIERK